MVNHVRGGMRPEEGYAVLRSELWVQQTDVGRSVRVVSVPGLEGPWEELPWGDFGYLSAPLSHAF